MNQIVIDTSAIIAVILNEPEKRKLIDITAGSQLFAPSSLHWEIGNAFSAMFKKKRLSIKEATKCLTVYSRIPIQFTDVDLKKSVQLSEKENIYAYDAYFILTALKYKAPLLTLDKELGKKAENTKIEVLGVK